VVDWLLSGCWLVGGWLPGCGWVGGWVWWLWGWRWGWGVPHLCTSAGGGEDMGTHDGRAGMQGCTGRRPAGGPPGLGVGRRRRAASAAGGATRSALPPPLIFGELYKIKFSSF
jgi:hypothetical protein